MSAISGLSGSGSSKNADQKSSSASKLLPSTWSEIQTKACTQCGQEKPINEFRTYTGHGRFGRRPLCKICQRQYEKRWRSQSTEYRREARKKRRVRAKMYSLEWRSVNRAAYLVAECRRRSAKRGWTFDLDQYVPEIQARIATGRCELTGYPLRLEAQPGRFFDTPSIDRIKPELGYIYSNIRVICFAANAMLGDWGEEAALSVAKAWIAKVGG